MKQAPHAWYETLTRYLKQSKFNKVSIDPNFSHKKAGNQLMIVQIYGDDIFLSSTDPNLQLNFVNLWKQNLK